MFRKLVSNLPFSPSLINQLGFYSKRLKKEQFTRKIGLIVTVLAIVVQTMTLLAPAEATLASSPNDIINGGGDLSAMQAIINSQKGCDKLGRCDVKQIFAAYGITSANLKTAKYEKIHSTVANNYWSIGRAQRSYGGVNVSKQIPGTNTTVYARTLHGWNGGLNKWWNAVRVETAQGTRWILTECGNIVTKESQPTQPPDVTTTKTVNKSLVKKGEKVTFTITYKNIGKGTAKNVLFYDDAPAGLDLVNDGIATDPIKSPRRWESSRRFTMAPGQSYTYKINAVVTKSGPLTLTNKACADIFDSNIYNNCDTVPVTVKPPCPIPGKEAYAVGDPECKTNPALVIEKTSDAKDLKIGDIFNYKLTVTNKGDVDLPKVVVRDVAPDEIEFLEFKQPGSQSFSLVTNKRDFVSSEFALKKKQSVVFELKAKVLAASTDAVVNQACALSVGTTTTAGACDETPVIIKEVCPTNQSIDKNDASCRPCPVEGKDNLNFDDPACKPCDETKQNEDGKDISCLELHKKARNITQQIENANGTKANAGDSIEYTLSVTNRSKETRKSFVVEENMEDVLEYADILDASGATFTTNPVKMLTWKPVDIKPNETITRTVLIKVKSVIPATPASTSDPLSYDMKMINIYGNTVEIELPSSPIKTVEQTVTKLPSTGLGANMIISTLMIMAATYFYFRSRTMVKEVGLVKQQFNYGAGV
jgi:uncharacterized repeat protein (TIGR01451 family)